MSRIAARTATCFTTFAHAAGSASAFPPGGVVRVFGNARTLSTLPTPGGAGGKGGDNGKGGKGKAKAKSGTKSAAASASPAAGAAVNAAGRRLTRYDVHPDQAERARVPLTQYTPWALSDLMGTDEPPVLATFSSRDFIHNSLYNPHYGYFSKNANIFTLPEPVDFGKLRNSLDFFNLVADMYHEHESKPASSPPEASTGEESSLPVVNDVARQVWHTPSELFRPWFGYAVAQRILSRVVPELAPGEPLRVYEIGGGNGTLMRTVLDYLRDHAPDVYRRTRYSIIEISAALARLQREAAARYHPKLGVDILQTSVLDVASLPARLGPCAVIAMEVVDNLAHDAVRWDLVAGAPMRGHVACDQYGEYEEYFTPVDDSQMAKCLHMQAERLRAPGAWAALLSHLPRSARAALTAGLPGAPNLSTRAFAPTTLLSLFEALRAAFPQHRLVLADFDHLPDTIGGGAGSTGPANPAPAGRARTNAPVVQTRYASTMVPVSTYLVHPGFFDIFFPTDFAAARDMYARVMHPQYCPERAAERALSWLHRDGGAAPPARGDAAVARLPMDEAVAAATEVVSHAAFLKRYADLKKTATRSGENPMLMYYENCSFLLS